MVTVRPYPGQQRAPPCSRSQGRRIGGLPLGVRGNWHSVSGGGRWISITRSGPLVTDKSGLQRGTMAHRAHGGRDPPSPPPHPPF